MSKKNFLKKFLTTTSALAMITSTPSAMARDLHKMHKDGIARIADGQYTTNTNSPKSGMLVTTWNPNDSFAFTKGKKGNLEIGTAPVPSGVLLSGTPGKTATILTIDVNGNAGRTITAKFDSSIASVVDSTRQGKTIGILISGPYTLSLGGNGHMGVAANGKSQMAGFFSGIGNITLGTGNDDAKLKFDINATLGGAIDHGATDGKGSINISAGKTATFNGVIGGKKSLNEITLDGAKSVAKFNEDVSATTITIKNATGEIQLKGGKKITGKVDSSVVGGGGKLIFLGGGEVTDTIGVTNPLTLVEAQGAGKIVTLNKGIKAQTLNIKKGATIDAKDESAAGIAAINIGEAGAAGGAGTLIIDAKTNDYELNNGAALS